MLKNLLELVIGTRTHEDDEDDAREVEDARESRRALGVQSTDSSSSGEHSTDEESSGGSTTSTTETDSESGDTHLLAPLTRYETRWRASNYLSNVPSRLYKLVCGQMARCAALFERHVAPLTPHYLLDTASVTAMPQRLQCYDIYIELAQRGMPIQGLGDTFLVPRALHYIYSYLVDHALRRREEPDAVRRRRHQYLKQKRRRMHFCQQHHAQGSDRYCPVEWVLYTRQSGQFAQFVQRIMDNNLCIDYNLEPHCVPQELSTLPSKHHQWALNKEGLAVFVWLSLHLRIYLMIILIIMAIWQAMRQLSEPCLTGLN